MSKTEADVFMTDMNLKINSKGSLTHWSTASSVQNPAQHASQLSADVIYGIPILCLFLKAFLCFDCYIDSEEKGQSTKAERGNIMIVITHTRTHINNWWLEGQNRLADSFYSLLNSFSKDFSRVPSVLTGTENPRLNKNLKHLKHFLHAWAFPFLWNVRRRRKQVMPFFHKHNFL